MDNTPQLPCLLSGSISWLMAATTHQLTLRVNTALETLALNFRSFVVMSAVADQPGSTQRHIGSNAGLDKTTLVAAIDHLEAQGLIQRSLCPTDRRIRTLTLTEQGQALYAQAKTIVMETECQALSVLNDTQRQELHDSLNTAAQQLRRDPGTGSCA